MATTHQALSIVGIQDQSSHNHIIHAFPEEWFLMVIGMLHISIITDLVSGSKRTQNGKGKIKQVLLNKNVASSDVSRMSSHFFLHNDALIKIHVERHRRTWQSQKQS